MSQKINQFLDGLTHCFGQGDFSAVAKYYDSPLGIYTVENVQIYTTAPDYTESLSARCVRYRDHGVCAISSSILATEISRDGRFRVWVEWSYHYGDRVDTNSANIIYYCKSEADTLKIQMVQTTHATLSSAETDYLPLTA